MLKVNRYITIPYESVTLEEAIYLMEHHDGECYCDCDRKEIVMVE